MARRLTSLKPLAPVCPSCSISTAQYVTSTAASTQRINCLLESRRHGIVLPASGAQVAIASPSDGSSPHEKANDLQTCRPVSSPERQRQFERTNHPTSARIVALPGP